MDQKPDAGKLAQALHKEILHGTFEWYYSSHETILIATRAIL